METNNSPKTLRKFNEQVTVVVEIDAIAEKLLNQFGQDNPLKESLTEQIIGSLRHAPNGITRLYNALSGMPHLCTYKVGDIVGVKRGDVSTYKWAESFAKLITLDAEILEIDEFAAHGVKVRYSYVSSEGEIKVSESKVSVFSLAEAEGKSQQLINEQIAYNASNL